jgi:hypothetical protein
MDDEQYKKVVNQMLKGMEKPTPEALYHQLGRLRNEMPPVQELGTAAASKWAGRAIALVEAVEGTVMEQATLRTYLDHATHNKLSVESANMIARVIDTVITKVELRLPAEAQGAFIPAGGVFDGYQAVAKALATARKQVFLIDPYGDNNLISDFVPLAPEGLPVLIMCDEQYAKPSLKPVAERWIAQWQQKRPLEVRLSSPRSLHDRLIVTDSNTAWVVGQSFKDLAKRAHSSPRAYGPRKRDVEDQRPRRDVEGREAGLDRVADARRQARGAGLVPLKKRHPATTRCTTDVPMPRVRPIFRMPIPSALSSRMRFSTEGATGRRPSLVPFSLARARPELTRSRIISRSNSANTPHIWNMARPEGVDVSSACWCR